jgi:hypothetical protein
MPVKPAAREKVEEPEMEPASAPSVVHVSRHKKKVYSKPIETKSCFNNTVEETELERK